MPARSARKTALVATVSIAATAVAAALGADAWSARAIDRAIADAAQRARAAGFVRIDDLRHARGLLASHGSATVRLEPGACATPASEDEPATASPAFGLRWTVRHLDASLSIAWTLEIDAPAAAAGAPAPIRAADGGATLARLEGTRGLGGAHRVRLVSAGLELTDPQGSVVRMGRMAGAFDARHPAMEGGLRIESMGVQRDEALGGPMSVGTMTAEMRYSDLARSVGMVEGSVERIATPTGGIDRMELQSSAAIEDGRYVGKGRVAARGIVADDRRLDSIEAEAAISGIDAAALARMRELAMTTCFFQKATTAQAAEARKLGARMLAEGFVVAMPSFVAQGPEGIASARLEVAVRPSAEDAEAGRIDFARGLRAAGEAALPGTALPAELRAMAVERGFAVARGEQFAAAFEFTPAGLTVNGRHLPEAQLGAAIARYAMHQGDLRLAEVLGTPAPAPLPMPAMLAGAGAAEEMALAMAQDEARARRAARGKAR